MFNYKNLLAVAVMDIISSGMYELYRKDLFYITITVTRYNRTYS